VSEAEELAGSAATCSGWGIHASGRMRDELGRRFAERHFEWVPYLYPDLGGDVSEAEELAAIEAGAINATGFRYVSTKRASAAL
jgi:hypothetical protein